MNGIPLAKRNVTFVELLKDAGYKTALIGKSHLQTFTGVEPSIKMQAARKGFKRADGDTHQVPMNEIGVAPHVHTIRHEGYRLSVYKDMQWGELYDLNNDPGEFDNLWDSVEATDIKLRLLELLVRAEIDHVDQSPFPTGRA